MSDEVSDTKKPVVCLAGMGRCVDAVRNFLDGAGRGLAYVPAQPRDDGGDPRQGGAAARFDLGVPLAAVTTPRRASRPADDRVYAAAEPLRAADLGSGSFPHDGTYVIALDAKTGKLLWKNDPHCETLFRWALSPNGNIYATEENLYVPNDVKPFRWAVFNSFKRSDGRHDAWAGTDPRSPGYGGTFMTLLGAVQDDKLYTGNGAKTLTEVVDPKTKKKTIKMSDAWSTDIKGYTMDSGSIQGYHPSRGAPLMHNPDLCAVIATDGVVYSIRYRQNGDKGVDGKVFAHSANDGKELWSAEIAEWPNEVIAANGRLFVSTSSGTIYAYAPKGAKQFGVVKEPVDAQQFGTGTSLAAAAEAIVKQAGIQEGYALVLDCTTGELARELAVRTKLHICAVFADEAQAAAARQAASRANLHVSRILIWVRRPGEVLPFPPRFADLIVSEAAAAGGALPSGRDALARLLKPVRGQAIIGGMPRPKKSGAVRLRHRGARAKKLRGAGHEARRPQGPLPRAAGFCGLAGRQATTARLRYQAQRQDRAGKLRRRPRGRQGGSRPLEGVRPRHPGRSQARTDRQQDQAHRQANAADQCNADSAGLSQHWTAPGQIADSATAVPSSKRPKTTGYDRLSALQNQSDGSSGSPQQRLRIPRSQLPRRPCRLG